MRFAPFLLDPSTPPEGKPRRPYTTTGDGPTPIEARAETLGIRFARGRTWTSNSHLALEAAEFVAEQADGHAFHRAMFKAYFEGLADIGSLDTILDAAASAGVDADALREALETGRYRRQVDDGIHWAQSIGVSGVPTFVFNDRYGVVGAQEYPVFQSMMERLGARPRS